MIASTDPLSAADRLIVALDVDHRAAAFEIVDQLEGVVSFFKVGYQLFVAEGMSLIGELGKRGKRIFLDLKMDDVDETIRLAVREIARWPVELLTVHGGAATARAARAGRDHASHPRILSVTLLSSLGESDLVELHILGPNGRFGSLDEYVLWRGTQAIGLGADGLIASGTSVGALRKAIGPEPLIVTPGVRPNDASSDEHQRLLTPHAAIAMGSDYLVVGRPIRNAPNRRAKAESIIEEIDRALTTNPPNRRMTRPPDRPTA